MVKWIVSALAIGVATLSATGAGANSIVPGVYALHNHPGGRAGPPDYGLRLDELFDVSRRKDIWTFDFDAERASMNMFFDGTKMLIKGKALGALDAGSERDQSTSSMARIRAKYIVEQVPGDDDFFVPTANIVLARAKVKWLRTGDVFVLTPKERNGTAFRFGDEGDDRGHRGDSGLSGWGWFLVDGQDRRGAQDFKFTATVIPLPAPAFIGGLGLLGLLATRHRNRDR